MTFSIVAAALALIFFCLIFLIAFAYRDERATRLFHEQNLAYLEEALRDRIAGGRSRLGFLRERMASAERVVHWQCVAPRSHLEGLPGLFDREKARLDEAELALRKRSHGQAIELADIAIANLAAAQGVHEYVGAQVLPLIGRMAEQSAMQLRLVEQWVECLERQLAKDAQKGDAGAQSKLARLKQLKGSLVKLSESVHRAPVTTLRTLAIIQRHIRRLEDEQQPE